MFGLDHIYIVTGLVILIISISIDLLAMSQNETANINRTPVSVSKSRYVLSGGDRMLKGNIWSGSLDTSYSKNLVERDEASRSEIAGVMGSLIYNYKDIWNLKSTLAYNETLKDPETPTNGVSDLGLSLTLKKLPDLKYFSQSVSLFNKFPLSRKSRDLDGLQTAVGSQYAVTSLKNWLMPGLQFYLSVSAYKNFHKYETSKSGELLTSYSLKEGAGISYEKNRLTFDIDISHSRQFNYENRVTEGISHSQEVAYEIIAKRWNFAIGHSNEGPWFKENGEDLNLEAVNDENSIFYIKTGMGF